MIRRQSGDKSANTKVSGNVTALEDGLLYTSIPGDKNWSVFVDGVKSEIVLIDNAMIAVRLNKGYNDRLQVLRLSLR